MKKLITTLILFNLISCFLHGQKSKLITDISPRTVAYIEKGDTVWNPGVVKVLTGVLDTVRCDIFKKGHMFSSITPALLVYKYNKKFEIIKVKYLSIDGKELGKKFKRYDYQLNCY